MSGKGLPWTAAHLRQASSAEEVRTALAEASVHLGDAPVPASTVLALLEELASESARMRTDLRAATRVREVLLASVAHDLRNPLNTFAMSAGLLRDDIEGPELDKSRAISLLSRMDRASARMQALIEDLLEASRIEAGTIDIARKPENAAAVGRAAIAKARPLVTEKGATLEEGSIDESVVLELDRNRSIEALVKLVAVALKTTGEGGLIRIGVQTEHDGGAFVVRASAPRGTSTAISLADENRGGLALLIARGLLTAQGGQLRTDVAPDGPRLLAVLPLAPAT